MKDNVIEVSNLSLPYAFQNFSLSIPRNKITVITGPNNCGKTTLIRSIIGHIFTDNTIYIFSQELEYYRITELNIIMKYIIPNEYIFNEETVFQEILSSLDNVELSASQKQKKVKDIIKKLNLTKFQNLSPNDQIETVRIKTQLAKCLLQSPKILLLDDVLLGMRTEDKDNIIAVLKEYQTIMDLTVIVTSSTLEDSLNCDYIYIIDNNIIVLEGAPKEVLQKDNVLNRLGLELPFMIDLSVKLRDYDLIDDVEMNMDIDGMVEQLWK